MRNILIIMVMLTLTSCAEMNLGYGLGKGSGSAGENELIVIKLKGTALYRFRSPLNPQTDWRKTYDIFDMKEQTGFFISQIWVGLSQGFDKERLKYRMLDPLTTYEESLKSDIDSGLEFYLTALQGKTTLAQAHTAYFSAFYPNAKVLEQAQRSIKNIQCMQTKAIYKGRYLIELQCPVFFRKTFGTMTYLMNTTTDMSFYFERPKYARPNALNDTGANSYAEYFDYHMPAFNHVVDTLEFIEPVSQTVPAGFSLDEQFQRMQNPKWKL